MTRANYALRLQASLEAEAESVSPSAKAPRSTSSSTSRWRKSPRLCARPTYLRERAARANLAEAQALLKSFGADKPTREGDEVDEPTAAPGR